MSNKILVFSKCIFVFLGFILLFIYIKKDFSIHIYIKLVISDS